MRSSWDEVEKLFINQWRQMSTPLHMIFMGKTVPLTLNGKVWVGDAAPPVLGSNFFVLNGPGLECFVASDVVTSVEYSEPDESPVRIRDTMRARYARFVEFNCDEGSTLLLGELFE